MQCLLFGYPKRQSLARDGLDFLDGLLGLASSFGTILAPLVRVTKVFEAIAFARHHGEHSKFCSLVMGNLQKRLS